jgi:hypothetical protein
MEEERRREDLRGVSLEEEAGKGFCEDTLGEPTLLKGDPKGFWSGEEMSEAFPSKSKFFTFLCRVDELFLLVSPLKESFKLSEDNAELLLRSEALRTRAESGF